MVPTKEIKKLRAFHNDATFKKEIVREVLKHQKQDQIIQGTYGDIEDGVWRGCAVGCSIHSYNLRQGKSIATNHHDFVSAVDLQDGAAIDGDTGIAVTAAADVRNLRIDTKGLCWLNLNVTAWSAGSVTAKAVAYDND